MRIIKLQAENVKRLRAVEVTPDGDVVIVSGRNGQGKTSVLDAIWFALGGGNATRDTQRVIRDGAEEASVTLDLGDFIVTRTWKGDKTTLRVQSPDGSRYPSPQTMLDGLLGKLSFDPLGFARQDARSQLATLLDLVQLPFDPAELEARRRTIFEQRTEVNRDLKQLEAQAAAVDYPPDTPDEPVNVYAIIESANNAKEWQYLAKTKRMNLDAKVVQVAELERVLAVCQEDLVRLRAEVAELPDPLPDPATYTAQLETLEETNRNVRAKQQRAALTAQRDEARDAAKRLTTQLDDLTTEKEAAIAAAAMPIQGLSLTDDGVTYLGVPFTQCSSAEQLRVSVAMAMALNPDVRVVRITDGSLLDSQSMAVIADMAARHDFQVWIERVDETGGVGVVIEDGSVVG